MLSDVNGNPMNLDDLRKETLKIRGLLQAILSNIDESAIPSSDFGSLRSKFKRYLDDYDFEGEMFVIAQIYSEDVLRINNMRIKILEALCDRKMMESVKYMVDEL